jgi:hypothetical protein
MIICKGVVLALVDWCVEFEIYVGRWLVAGNRWSIHTRGRLVMVKIVWWSQETVFVMHTHVNIDELFTFLSLKLARTYYAVHALTALTPP